VRSKPNLSGTQRARSSEDKAARRDSLLAAARGLMRVSAYEKITLSAVAAAAGLSKGSAYTYFPTKESLFLNLLRECLDVWRAALLAAIPPRTRSPRTIALAIANTLEADPVLRDLLGRCHATLEVNVPDEEIVAFKWFLADLLTACAVPIERACPGLKPGQAQHLFLLVHSLVIGLGMVTNRPPNVSRALAAEPELQQAFDIDFAAELASVIELVLRGWLTENRALEL
jgi:AcrR family transcriptional regulator